MKTLTAAVTFSAIAIAVFMGFSAISVGSSFLA